MAGIRHWRFLAILFTGFHLSRVQSPSATVRRATLDRRNPVKHFPIHPRQARSSSLIDTFERVFSSTLFTITAQ